jgi:hypothetical protein
MEGTAMAIEPDPVNNPMNFFVREYRTEKITDPELREKTIAKVDDHLQREKEAVATYREKAAAKKAQWDKALNLLGEKNPVRKVGSWLAEKSEQAQDRKLADLRTAGASERGEIVTAAIIASTGKPPTPLNREDDKERALTLARQLERVKQSAEAQHGTRDHDRER